ncbi:MAG TPA: phosphodiesterase [Alphaproteobacteria bacterium]|nr:phosphodiesterase [Alphaproteobacteria bacterium]
MIIAQLTDTHVCAAGVEAYGRVATNDMLRAAVRHLGTLVPRPDVVIATGDLCHEGGKEEYAALRELLAPLAMPVFLIPGNHDEREALASSFPEHAYLPRDGGFLHYVVEDYPVRLVGLDTVIPGEAGGRMCAARLAWFERRLDEAEARPTLVFMHHPPFATGIGHMDEIGLEGADAFARIVARHPEIERIVCGHLHRPIQMRWHGTLASTAPSTAHQVVLDLSPAAAGTFNLEPPACQLHVFDPAQGIVSHTSYIGSFAGPYPFAAAEGGS